MANHIFLGLTTVDIFQYVSRYPGSNEKIRAQTQKIYAGGPAANGAVALSGLGSDATLITGIGMTPLGELARQDLEKFNVQVLDLALAPQQLPIISAITIDESCGDRSVIYSDTSGRKLTSEYPIDDLIDKTEAVLLDGYYLPLAIQLAKVAKHNNIPVILDGGSWKQGLEFLLPYVDIAICSQNFTPPYKSKQSSVADFFRQHSVDQVAITRGGEPILLWDYGEFERIVIPETSVCDTLGAGDILHGAFVHFYSHNGFKNGLQKACQIATMSCRYRGTREWIEYL